MKLYRVHLYSTQMCSEGYEFFTSRTAAEQRAKQHHEDAKIPDDDPARCSVNEVEFVLTKKDVLRTLQRYATHPDNG